MTIARALLLVVALCGWAAFEVATDSIGVFVTAQGVSYIVFEQITVANTAIGFTSTKVEPDRGIGDRSEEHTSELQSLTNLVCRLLLEKKKKIKKTKKNKK